jgi:hypothetical protein
MGKTMTARKRGPTDRLYVSFGHKNTPYASRDPSDKDQVYIHEAAVEKRERALREALVAIRGATGERWIDDRIDAALAAAGESVLKKGT